MDEDFKAKLIDRFYAWELVELLDISTEDLIDALTDEIATNRDFLEEMMTYGR